MHCTNCGNEIKENEKFCTNCGTKIITNLNNEDIKIDSEQEIQPEKINTNNINNSKGKNN